MAIGNIIGTNIFNICIVIGLPVVILGEISSISFSIVDMAVMVLSVVLLWIFSFTNRKISRFEAASFLILFLAYYLYIFV
ncbi:MAG: hypothetical protein FWC68_02715 [Oscillospiraceae bacterium]|nr:hypothetical protein [Oscillospiraceae bacterium]